LTSHRPLSGLFAVLFLCAASFGFSPVRAQSVIAHAQPPLRTEPLQVTTGRGVFRFNVEIADTPRRQEIGMMYRPPLAADHGMLFEFARPQEVAFWMKNCPYPLDMLFIGADGRIISIVRNATPQSETPLPSGGPITGVLEIHGGRASQMGAEPGDLVRHKFFHN
jgi:uncharacterized membrane protein (UPF0127 family)